MNRAEFELLIAGGQILARSGFSAEARAVLRAVLAEDPDNLEALLWLGVTVEDTDEALRLIGRAYTVAPTSERAAAGLAWARERHAEGGGRRVGRLRGSGKLRVSRRPSRRAQTPVEPPAPIVQPAAEPRSVTRPSHPGTDARVSGLLAEARAAIDSGAFEAAILAADEAARLAPGSVEALSSLGLALYLGGRGDDSERIYRRMLVIQPEHAEALANLGLIYAEAGKGDAAERFYERALEVDPTMEEVRLALADLLLSQGRVDAAIDEWRIAAERNPTINEFQVRIGDAYAQTRRYEEAAAAYTRAIEHTDDDPSLRLRLARMLRESGRSGAALEQLRQASRSPLATVECFIEFADALLEVGSDEEAAEMVDRAAVLSPSDPLVLEMLERLAPVRYPAYRPEMPAHSYGASRGMLDSYRRT